MTAPVVERSTTADVARVRAAALECVSETGSVALTDLLDHLVRQHGHRVEVASRALSDLMTERQLELTPSRTVRLVQPRESSQ